MNGLMELLFLTDCGVLCIVPLYFVVNSVYKDGVFGRAGLLGVSFAAGTFILEYIGGQRYEILPQTLFLITSFAVFLCWHLCRFHIRIIKQRRAVT